MGSINKKPRKRMGRPMRYANLLRSLDPDLLYSAGAIARLARDSGYLATYEPEVAPRLALLRIRITLGRLAKSHEFPREGDGLITLKSQMPSPAWFGWRWQRTCTERRHSS